LIPADAPPSFDGHRETTYATVHAVAPFYSVLIRVNPDNPSSTTDFVCVTKWWDESTACLGM
jgi:peptide/nickel transport system substrate-binding protein